MNGNQAEVAAKQILRSGPGIYGTLEALDFYNYMHSPLVEGKTALPFYNRVLHYWREREDLFAAEEDEKDPVWIENMYEEYKRNFQR